MAKMLRSMHMCTTLLLVGLTTCLLLRASLAAQCMPDPTNPCVARCNGSTFDVSKVFNYPINITGSDGYSYVYSPCRGYACPNAGSPTEDSAVCQGADQFYSCGIISQPIFLLEQYSPYLFRIQYPWGFEWRISVFNFVVDEHVATPTITFTGEEPYLQYNFEIRGKCIGQPYCQPGEEPFPRKETDDEDAALRREN